MSNSKSNHKRMVNCHEKFSEILVLQKEIIAKISTLSEFYSAAGWTREVLPGSGRVSSNDGKTATL